MMPLMKYSLKRFLRGTLVMAGLLASPTLLWANWTIEEIQVEPVEQHDLVLSIVPLREGILFDDEIRDLSVRLLQATGRFETLSIRGEATTKTVRVMVVLRDYIEDIVWSEEPAVSSAIESRCLSPNEPAAVSHERLEALEGCFQDALYAEGYLEGKVAIHHEHKILRLESRLGRRFRIGKVVVEGLERLKPDLVLEGIRNREGTFFSGSHLRDDTRRMMRNLLENDHFFVEVFEPRIEKQEEGFVTLTWKVEESYPIRIEFTGHRRSREKIRELIDREMTFPKWYLEEILEMMKNDFVAEGYLEATVNVERTVDAKGVEHIHIHSRQGPRTYLLWPQFVGVNDDRALSNLFRNLYEIASGQPFREQEYEAVVSEEFLNRVISQGYLDVRIRDVDFTIDRDRHRALPSIYINLGDKYFIEETQIEGFPIELDHLQEWHDFKKAVRPGGVVDLLLIDQMQRELQRALVAQGFLDISIQRDLVKGRGSVKVVVRMVPGPRYRVSRVLIRGAVKTDYRVLQNEILLKPGDFFEEERVRESVSQILRLGIARSVDIQALEKDPAQGRVFAMVDITEAARYRFEVGPGFGTSDGVRGVFRATWANIGGRGRRLSLYSKGSRKLESADRPSEAEVFNPQKTPFIQRRVTLEYFEPSLFNWRLDGRLNYTHAKEQRDNLFGERNSVSGAVDYRWSRRWILTSFYELAFSDPFNVKKDGKTTEEDARPKRFTSVGEALLVDFLDDSFNPTKGFRSRLEGAIYNEKLGGEVDMWQATVKQEFFNPLYTFRKGRSIGLALSVSSGFSGAYGRTSDVPVEKRLRVGGESSVRGYGEGAIRPRLENGEEQDGGNSFFSFMSELHIPVAGEIDFLLFLDGGRAFVETSDFRPWGLRLGAGPGFRINTPVGPLKAGYGFVVFPREGEPLGTFYLGVGAI